MPPRKRRRAYPEAPPPTEATTAQTLPPEILLEIVARSDAATIVRSAACCKALRRDVLSADFIRRVCHEPGGPACLLGFIHAYDNTTRRARPPAPFSLVHPATPAAVYFSEKHVVPLFSGADLLGRYRPLASGRGLVVLERQNIGHRWRTDICVYDPMTGDRAFFSSPPDIRYVDIHTYVLVTAADGVGCSFLLLAADFTRLISSGSINVQTVSSDAADHKWGALTLATPAGLTYAYLPGSVLRPCCSAVVLGTLIHWLLFGCWGSMILTYDVGTTAAGSIELPSHILPRSYAMLNLLLRSSPDGRLRLLVAHQLTISIWLQVSTGAGWARHAVIDAQPILPSLVPELPLSMWATKVIRFWGSEGRCGTVLLRPFTRNYMEDNGAEDGFLLLDMETKEIRRVNRKSYIMSFLYELDLASRLSAMKIFEPN